MTLNRRRRWVKVFAAFISSVVVTYCLATIAATQFALNAIVELGLPVNMLERVRTTGHDLLGMTQLYLPLLAIGLGIALAIAQPLAGWLARRWPSARWLVLISAGFASVIAVNVALNLSFDITPIAAARTPLGLIVQGLSGLAGAAVFARMTASG